MGIHVRAPKWTNFKDALGKYLGARQVEGLENYRFIRRITKAVPDRARQEGITNWIQADGDPRILRLRADATTDARLKKGYEAALNLTDDEKAMAVEVRAHYDRMAKEAIDAGVLENAINNYVTQVWAKENPITRRLRSELSAGLLNTNFRYARKRIFDSYFDGELAGFKPVDKLLPLQWRNIIRACMKRLPPESL